MKVYKLVESLPQSLPSGSGVGQSDIKSESQEYIVSGHIIVWLIFLKHACIPYSSFMVVLLYFVQVNGINILRLSARDVYAYGLQLIDILFTKEEQSHSLLFSSKKSSKPGLDKERVDRLLGECDVHTYCIPA